ncbi:MAG: hypothetical protein D5R97_08045 [Candidatus Syntrophonatronum acetioxidans]|uniref:Uncharacterized protein n=1 Tax=Candidatus Syntrophonatronum acetioxidans TaxID=1795816 RepID=A0A424YBV6_9FIRM|nr:MAG: hypothetical protein D5R97_08045 [Candidatus Syntrophonatronum acetioxidans]
MKCGGNSRKWAAVLAFLFFWGVCLYPLPGEAAETITMKRIFGENRFETAVKISQEGWAYSPRVLLARADDFPDALAGAPLAHRLEAPILLTGQGSLHQSTQREIERLGARQVIILGGEAALSPGVEENLREMGLEVQRIGGEDRYETARLIAGEMGFIPGYKAVVVSGTSFPDALAAGAYAAGKGYPILLTRQDSLPSSTQKALQEEHINQTILVGGPLAVGEEVEKELPSPRRIGGEDRYETAVEVVVRLNIPGDKLFVATGEDFADALTGSVLAAREGGPLVLVSKEQTPHPVVDLIKAGTFTRFSILGGPAAVSYSNSLVSRSGSTLTPIMGTPRATLEQARRWAAHRGAHPDFIQVAALYWEIGPQLGVRPEVAYAQSAKETNYGKFTGVVSRDFNNWCGLKIFQGGPCSEPEAHASFPDDRTGVMAHYHHLMTYAGVEVPGGSLSPRSSLVRVGCAPYVEWLGARWAPSDQYGYSIVYDYLGPLMRTR